MKEIFKSLKKQIASFTPVKDLNENHWNEIKNKITVLLMAGGEGSRFSPITQNAEVNKNSFVLPNNDTMIEMCIRLYKEAGIKNFVALLYHKAESIESILGDGSKLGINLSYSYDPGKPVGKGGAVKHAIEQGLIPNNHYFVVHNPDDVILDYEGNFPKHIISAHIQGENNKALCTVVVVEEVEHQFSAMKVVNNFVEEVDMYPIIPLPTHIGVTVFSPKAKKYFIEQFSYNKKEDFEKKLFPILAKEKRLYCAKIPLDCWIPVNNPKNYKDLLKRLNLT